MRERYVLLGLARARVPWFRAVGQWAASASLPVEFLRCVSADEVRARLDTGRAFSALLVDADVPGLDRDLVAAARAAGCAVLVVDSLEASRDWRGIGVDAVLAPVFSRDELLEVLGACARAVDSAEPDLRPDRTPSVDQPSGRLVAVTGPGGTGASTTAIALAQGAAAGHGIPRRNGSADPVPDVLLADLCRRADQAMLHDARSLVPGIQEVVEAHRSGTPSAAELREQTFEVPERGYRLLLGLRRPRHWSALRPRAVEAALGGLTRLADLLVVDVEADVEGELETGSVDVEDRHALSRTAFRRADVVVVVGEPSMKGCFALVRTLGELLEFGVDATRVLPVVNRAPRTPRQRAELTTSIATLLAASADAGGDRLANPLYLPSRKVDEALRDGVGLPAPLPALVARAVQAVLDRAAAPAEPVEPEPVPIAPGSLSAFSGPEPTP
ncbi:hypothetical protein [Egicoccus halophilus]|uniref:CobQ/CobB/MinD/ParA nucleotide binding domain-containing protein n=1 Tax=Egicoccus halophilus TaxID=1670830 RepID=A0A8J3A7L4_9ACTN|nr:hypothetical protein [Egicoccus halophilus]GGI05607.1 hypothetical protein GCM10011354_14930 [Egicoccus halophilus]